MLDLQLAHFVPAKVAFSEPRPCFILGESNSFNWAASPLPSNLQTFPLVYFWADPAQSGDFGRGEEIIIRQSMLLEVTAPAQSSNSNPKKAPFG